MSTFYTFLHDKSNLSTMKEDIVNAISNNINAILSNIKVQVSNPPNPNGITSTTPQQVGLGVTYTPSLTGRVLILVFAEASNNTAGYGAVIQLSYGTGSPPSNGAPATGTAVGNQIYIISNAASQLVPFSLGYILTGLQIGTQYWFDLQVGVYHGGAAFVQNVTVLIIEF